MTIANSDVDVYTEDNLIAGSAPIVTDSGILLTGQNLPRGSVVGRILASDKLVECDLAAVDGSEKAIGILVHPIDASAADKACQIYTGGEFHSDEMTWHASFDTDGKKHAAFDGSAVVIR